MTYRRKYERDAEDIIVLIASANREVVRRWKHGLQGVFEIHKVTARAALEQGLVGLKPTVLFLDLALPDLGGIMGVRELRRLSSATKIVLFTSVPDEKEAVLALQSGLEGYCNKDINPALLRRAVSRLQEDEIWIPPKLLRELLTASLNAPQHKDSPEQLNDLNCLTARKREIAQLISKGSSNKEIATLLNVSVATVKAHLTAIFRKLRLSDRVSLAIYVTQHKRVSR
jgi:two-component system nitrate/nitrite response regulator NarL